MDIARQLHIYFGKQSPLMPFREAALLSPTQIGSSVNLTEATNGPFGDQADVDARRQLETIRGLPEDHSDELSQFDQLDLPDQCGQ